MPRRDSTKCTLTADFVRSILNYDPKTGLFTWKHRSADTFELAARHSREQIARLWNPRYAGKPAGHCDSYGYHQIKINSVYYLAHRMAWLFIHGEWPEKEMDHINGNRADNRLVNLRLCSRMQNMANSGRKSTNKSGYKGVYLKARHTKKRWASQIRAGGKQITLGYFDTPEAAHAAYVKAAKELHGAFHRTE